MPYLSCATSVCDWKAGTVTLRARSARGGNDLIRRLAEHFSGYATKSYSLLHRTTRLVHYEVTPNVGHGPLALTA
jgi:hypothetical protein